MNWNLVAQLLADEDESSSSNSSAIVTYVFLGIIIVALIVVMIISSRRNKKRQKESENLIAAVKPGNKVKTIGGVCGIVVAVDNEENTFVLETGSEDTGKCYMKFDKQAIYQTDAVPESTNPDDKIRKGKEGEEEGELQLTDEEVNAIFNEIPEKAEETEASGTEEEKPAESVDGIGADDIFQDENLMPEQDAGGAENGEEEMKDGE